MKINHMFLQDHNLTYSVTILYIGQNISGTSLHNLYRRCEKQFQQWFRWRLISIKNTNYIQSYMIHALRKDWKRNFLPQYLHMMRSVVASFQFDYKLFEHVSGRMF